MFPGEIIAHYLLPRHMLNVKAPWNLAIAIPTLVGSILSCLATGCVIVCWVLFNGQKRSFRYALILNLTVAEFIGALNNSISGLYATVKHKQITVGPACSANGWICQLSVQASDFSILAIAVVTLLTIQFKSYILYASFETKLLICVSIWVVPIATSTTALAMDVIKPVSGNWCWISRDHTGLRYALGHGWRFAIIIITIIIYIYVFILMRRRLARRTDVGGRSYSFDYGAETGFEMNFRMAKNGPLQDGSSSTPSKDLAFTPKPWSRPTLPRSNTAGSDTLTFSPRIRHHLTTNIDKEVWNVILLNLYPLTYVILWIPGIVNRIAEATGHYKVWFGILQCSMQYVGFANALVYGFREHSGDIARWFKKRL